MCVLLVYKVMAEGAEHLSHLQRPRLAARRVPHAARQEASGPVTPHPALHLTGSPCVCFYHFITICSLKCEVFWLLFCTQFLIYNDTSILVGGYEVHISKIVLCFLCVTKGELVLCFYLLPFLATE